MVGRTDSRHHHLDRRGRLERKLFPFTGWLVRTTHSLLAVLGLNGISYTRTEWSRAKSPAFPFTIRKTDSMFHSSLNLLYENGLKDRNTITLPESSEWGGGGIYLPRETALVQSSSLSPNNYRRLLHASTLASQNTPRELPRHFCPPTQLLRGI